MATYFKLNNENKIENTILAEKDFIESQPDKEKYVRLVTNEEELTNSFQDKSYALNKPTSKVKIDRENNKIIIEEEPIYNFEKRKFKNPQPYASWTFDEESYEWIPPVPKPKEKVLVWNEEKQQWIEVEV
jgi:hypothetical protein